MRRTKFLELARNAGFLVQEEGFRTLIFSKGEDPVGVAIYTDGAAHRADVDLSVTKKMSISECAKLLDLGT
jgi:hypothetical protein